MTYKSSNVTIMISDMAKAIAFYRDGLGLELVKQYGPEWAELAAPGVRIGLHPGGKKPLADHPRHISIGLEVEDIDAAIAELRDRGIKIGDAKRDKGLRLADLTDPDGNPLYLCEVKWG
jgi:catechol 2,3-dioxygenase-like lactoylglutathione lyase family enzyme